MRRILFLLASVAVFALLGREVLEAETLSKEGEIVLMALAPVDPRSLMQGDYMRLAFAMEREVTIEAPGDHRIVVGLDARRVASFKRIADATPPAADERLFTVKGGAWRTGIAIEPHSFLFQEGRADDFAKAKFGVFRVAADGRHLLVALAGADGLAIGPR